MFIVDTFCGYLSFNPNMAHYDAAYPRGVHLIIHGILWSTPAIPTAASKNIGVVCQRRATYGLKLSVDLHHDVNNWPTLYWPAYFIQRM
ncbi:hypothetical protein [Oceanimonas sp. GK1]|uniref:hypothetical protein n=1 Tax=Oceanimonas sp. (strain GK1 / IBRC-M 10197) TaxID=511062 RepID=UPI00059F6E23|nr:hypothetical protein [Oceanimonas sp. GK1]